jgi:Uma2 family endonuclease
MATTVETGVRPAEGERRFVIHNVGWEGYQTLLGLTGRRPVRLTYDRGNIELMSPLNLHELYKTRFGYMVEAITEELEIPRFPTGSTTFNRQDIDRGLEPDESYYLASLGLIHDRGRIDLNVDPPPDLAIEIDITSSSLDRLEIYAALGFPEIWRYDGEALTVLLLRNDGTYAPSGTSAAFPFLSTAELGRFLKENDSPDETRWGRGFRAWVRDELVPRVRDATGGVGQQ